jgi:uncharacterized integral membrane protein
MTSYTQPTGPNPQIPDVTLAGETAAPSRRRRRVPRKLIVAVVILAIVAWFAAVNTRNIQIKLWVENVSSPIWIVLLCTFAAGVITGWLLRRRRRPTKKGA